MTNAGAGLKYHSLPASPRTQPRVDRVQFGSAWDSPEGSTAGDRAWPCSHVLRATATSTPRSPVHHVCAISRCYRIGSLVVLGRALVADFSVCGRTLAIQLDERCV